MKIFGGESLYCLPKSYSNRYHKCKQKITELEYKTVEIMEVDIQWLKYCGKNITENSRATVQYKIV